MKALLKTLIEQQIIQYDKLIMSYYHRFDLTEQEAVALIRLNQLREENQTLIKPEKFCKWVSMTPKQTETVLESLINKGYLKMKLTITDDGKAQEVFDTDYFLMKVIECVKQKNVEYKETKTSQWVQFLEDTLQTALTPLDIEIITKWIEEDQYAFDMVKEATFKALKSSHPSIKKIDSLLLDSLKTIPKNPRKKDVLKEFYKLWDE